MEYLVRWNKYSESYKPQSIGPSGHSPLAEWSVRLTGATFNS